MIKIEIEEVNFVTYILRQHLCLAIRSNLQES